ncbi:hypothetical protein BGX27_004446, partial [Mortierella sp. AM989]
YPGRMHDSAAYKTSKLYLNPENYFEGSEFILSDAAFAVSHILMPRYRGVREDRVEDKDKRRFNRHLGTARVKVEHAF